MNQTSFDVSQPRKDWLPTPYYGSQLWANEILKLGIAECRNLDRDRLSRLQEIIHYEKLLRDGGWVWQFQILKFWEHRFWNSLHPKGDPIEKGGGASICQYLPAKDDSIDSFFKVAKCPKCYSALRLVLGSINYYWKCGNCGFWIVGPLRQLVEKEILK